MLPERTLLFDERPQIRTRIQRRFDCTPFFAGDFAVGIGDQFFFGQVHRSIALAWPKTRAASAVRARASRLVTVPMGTFSTSAASR